MISVFYFTCNHRQWLHVKLNTEITFKIISINNFFHM